MYDKSLVVDCRGQFWSGFGGGEPPRALCSCGCLEIRVTEYGRDGDRDCGRRARGTQARVGGGEGGTGRGGGEVRGGGGGGVGERPAFAGPPGVAGGDGAGPGPDVDGAARLRDDGAPARAAGRRRRATASGSATRSIRWTRRWSSKCLSVFPWAEFRRTKGAVKVHAGLDHAGGLPAFAQVTDGKTADIEAARALRLPKGSIVAADRAYMDFEWIDTLIPQGVFLVARLKRRVCYRVLERRPANRALGVTSDRTIEFSSARGRKRCPHRLRRIGYRDPATGRHHVFPTTNFKLSACATGS